MSFPEYPAIYYKGVSGFDTQEKCEKERVPMENYMTEIETKRGKTAISIESYCLPYDTFKFKVEDYETGTGTES